VAEPEATWQSWLDRHGPAALLFARQITGNAADAEDALQEGFIRFWRHRDAARDPTALLYTSVRSAAMDLRRGERRRRDRQKAIGRERPETALFESAGAGPDSAAIHRALAELPEAQREVVVLKIWAGLTLAQIAESVGESANTVASRYRYAMEKLAGLLASEVSDG
jgi:RNA polymerase sigma-70 factor, ECF subfamily